MSDNEDLPLHLLQELKDEVDVLRKKLLQPDAKAQELILEIESLKDSIHELTGVFQKALEETKEENVGVLLKTINERLEAVVSQNETIAKGMLAISDKVEDFISRQRMGAVTVGISPTMPGMPTAMSASAGPGLSGMATPQQTMGFPSLRGPRMAPLPEAGSRELLEPDLTEEGVPPPPPGPRKRMGLFK